ncbi:hypothetical protein GDO86_019530 [Hymenochirus boettgeri]|uniref:Tyrosine specific protein phosphatases domain-containing protein n=1 Tax=Hymenochirus boettgeri TaxID=247094 RepID=A0A8T2IJU0_9PIPI|nr:hypothetical protein GDO86_019530 [Hymenochirus boettgeri]
MERLWGRLPSTILDMVKVMALALQEGKVAVHCHAGLGRTGVLIACYLIFATRMTADQAILFVRAKRPNTIQTRVQLLCIREFTQFLTPLHNVFSCSDPKAHAVTLSQYLIRQQHLLHGYEARHLKYVPKIIHLVCKLLLDLVENRQVLEEEILEGPDLTVEIEKTVSQLPRTQLDKVLGDDPIGLSVNHMAGLGQHDSVLSSEQEFDPLWKRRNVEYLQPLSHLKKRLSYSDSDLKKAELLLEQGETPWTEPAQMPFLNKLQQLLDKQCFSPRSNELVQPTLPPAHQSPMQNSFSFWTQAKPCSLEQRDGSPLFPRKKHPKEIQRSRTFSLGFSSLPNDQSALPDSELKNSTPNSIAEYVGDCSCATGGDDVPGNANGTQPTASFYVGNESQEELPHCVPCIVLQSELNREARKLEVAKSLGDRPRNSEDKIAERVKVWQKELNARESAWDRVCTERDPFVLCHLMWSWVEQLKEPVVTKEDIDLLSGCSCDLETALYLLKKGQHQTILCILQCVGQLHPIPSELEEALLGRFIEAFTKVKQDSEKAPQVYNTLMPIFRQILLELHK